MTSPFKRKSRSLSNCSRKVYSKINSKFSQEKWRVLLQSEINLQQIVSELSKAEFDLSNQNHMKYSARQNLQMKKEIIKYLERQQIDEGLIKLRQLSEKIPFPLQKKRIQLMIIFLEGKKILQQCFGCNKEQNAIIWLKDSIGEHINSNQIHLVKIKIMTVLSVLLLRFHGILMSAEEKLILFRTIELKKKQLMLLDNRKDKQLQFECLLYLMLQLYKILFLLKKDQQIILAYFNQLQAYTQVYAQRQQNKLYLDLQQIERVLTNMKPILNQLDIYEDSKIRKDFAFANIQSQITHNQRESIQVVTAPQKSIEPKLNTIKNSGQIRIRSNSNVFNKKLIIQRNSKLIEKAEEQPIIQLQNSEAMEQLQNKGLVLSFILILHQKVYITDFKIKLRNSCNLIDLQLRVKDERQKLQIYNLMGIQTLIDKKYLSNFCKFLEKLIKNIFKIQGQFRQLHNLSISQQYIPNNIDQQNLIPALIRSKTFIKEYLRNRFDQNAAIGSKFVFPNLSLTEITQHLQQQLKQKENKKQKGLFFKRKGQFQKDSFNIIDPPSTSCIKTLIKNLSQNIFFDEYFRGFQIYCFTDYQQPPQLSDYIQAMKKMALKFYCHHQTVNNKQKKKIIEEVLSLQNQAQKIIEVPIDYRLEEQLQIDSLDSYKGTPLRLKLYNKQAQIQKKLSKITQKQYQIVKTGKKQYLLFVKQCYNNEYLIYHNDQAKIYLPLNWQDQNWKLQKNRLRMYSGIKIVTVKNGLFFFIRTENKDHFLIYQQQEIVLKLMRHQVIRKRKGYCILLEYMSSACEYLYEIIMDKKIRYFSVGYEKIEVFSQSIVNFQTMTLNGKEMNIYTEGRKSISEANHHFITLKDRVKDIRLN